jgi:hypothetical protein
MQRYGRGRRFASGKGSIWHLIWLRLISDIVVRRSSYKVVRQNIFGVKRRGRVYPGIFVLALLLLLLLLLNGCLGVVVSMVLRTFLFTAIRVGIAFRLSSGCARAWRQALLGQRFSETAAFLFKWLAPAFQLLTLLGVPETGFLRGWQCIGLRTDNV